MTDKETTTPPAGGLNGYDGGVDCFRAPSKEPFTTRCGWPLPAGLLQSPPSREGSITTRYLSQDVKGVIFRFGARQEELRGISIMFGHPGLPEQGHITKGGLYHVQE